MRQISCDVAIIGAGTAGLAARSAAAEGGARAVLIEAGPGGTTCARFGCMPSKLLIAAAAAAEAAGRIGTFGLRLDGRVAVDGPAVMERVRRERDRFVASVLAGVDKIPPAERVQGRARFVGPTSLDVEGHTRVEARAVVIATGAKAAVPDELAALGDLVLTNETVFELTDLPRSLGVVGAGPLGIELAQAFARLGVRVVVLDKANTVAGLADPDAERRARELLGAGLDLRLGVSVEAERTGDGALLRWRQEGGEEGGEAGSATVERVLAAAGRPPNLDDLDLGRAGLALDRRGVPLFDPATLRCGESPVFIAGDADGDRPVLHEAAEEGRIAGGNAARFPAIERSRRQTPLSIVYTDPEIAVVGAGWDELRSRNPAVGEADLAESGRAQVLDRAAGLIRVYAGRQDRRILGGTLVGPGAEHLGHLLAWAVEGELTADAMLALPFYHPTLEESLRSAVRQVCGELRTRPSGDFGRGAFGLGT